MSKSKAMTTRAAAERPMDLASMRRPPTHPGEVFREDFRLPQDPPLSQAEASRRLGWSKNRMNEFELGQRPLTTEGAVALELLTGISAEFWMGLQVRYDLWHEWRKTRTHDVQPLKATA